jgi:hypothetical protein
MKPDWFYGLFPGGKTLEWRREGNDWYIPFNVVCMLAAAGGSAYAFVLAAVRSKQAPPQESAGQG